METTTALYTVRQTAVLAGITVRTLHHYDEIGLLRPAQRSDAGYRMYGRQELLRLQQILFYRELDMPLAEIRAVLSDPEFDILESLEDHRQALRRRSKRLEELIRTVERTMDEIRGERAMLTDEDLYRGFSRETVDKLKAESEERWSEEYARVDANIRRMSKEQWQEIQAEGEAINRELAALVGSGEGESNDGAPRSDGRADSPAGESANDLLDPAGPKAQALVERHHAWIEHFYEADATRYSGLADMYVADERFSAHYDAYAPGLSRFLSAAMKHYARTRLE